MGTWGCPMPMIRESRCIAKLMRLFPSWTVQPLENDVRQCEFNVAKALIDEPPPTLEQISVLENEMLKADMLAELKGLLHLMLDVNSNERLSATHVLTSKKFLTLNEALADMK